MWKWMVSSHLKHRIFLPLCYKRGLAFKWFTTPIAILVDALLYVCLCLGKSRVGRRTSPDYRSHDSIFTGPREIPSSVHLNNSRYKDAVMHLGSLNKPLLPRPHRWSWRHILAQALRLGHTIRKINPGIVFTIHFRNSHQWSRISAPRSYDVYVSTIYVPLSIANRIRIWEGHKMLDA